MVTFLVALLALIVGFFVYGKFVDSVFGPTDKPTPAVVHNDGVDYIPLPTWKVFLIQLLNIAGLGPIFGALGGALWGPSVYLWIVFGTIFAGAVHDYLSGMISLREDGKSISEVVGHYMGPVMLIIMRVFAVVLLVLVGTVFATGPAGLLAKLTGTAVTVILPCVFLYYFLATLLPVDTLIARFYPLFGACLIIMALGIMGAMLFGVGGHVMPDMTLENLHPAGSEKMPIWPLMFITVACGAISGFHSTQSPIMSRCLKDERLGRPVFYGAMVSEGIIALIWATAGITFYDGTGGLAAAMKSGPGNVVYEICVGFMGAGIGATLAMLGVIACPLTSGDTAFRSARLTLADWIGLEQKNRVKRLYLAVPILGVGCILSQMDFNIIWRYFSWTNQTLAMIVLWTGAVYLHRTKPGSMCYLIPAIPATFMAAVTFTYILQAPEGLQLGTSISYPAGFVFAAVCVALFARTLGKSAPGQR